MALLEAVVYTKSRNVADFDVGIYFTDGKKSTIRADRPFPPFPREMELEARTIEDVARDVDDIAHVTLEYSGRALDRPDGLLFSAVVIITGFSERNETSSWAIPAPQRRFAEVIRLRRECETASISVEPVGVDRQLVCLQPRSVEIHRADHEDNKDEGVRSVTAEGYLRYEESTSKGDVFYYEAPPAFANSDLFGSGGVLDIQLATLSESENFFSAADLVAKGAGLTIYRSDLFTKDVISKEKDPIWFRASVILVADGWRIPPDDWNGWTIDALDRPADNKEVEAVFADLSMLRVRGEFADGNETGLLREMCLLRAATSN